MSRSNTVFCIIPMMMLAGCAGHQEKYSWGNYDPSLYDYYKSPAKVGELVTSLQASIDAARAHGQPTPPGIRAEYGYLLLQQGRVPEAVAQFQSEEKAWPESKVFMDHMIKVASSDQTVAESKSP